MKGNVKGRVLLLVVVLLAAWHPGMAQVDLDDLKSDLNELQEDLGGLKENLGGLKESLKTNLNVNVPGLKSVGGIVETDSELVINVGSQKIEKSLVNGSVVVNSGNNEITLKGSCSELVINASENTIFLDQLGILVLNGSKNVIRYRSAGESETPTIVDNGADNSVEKVKE